ncbi:hypothetical protein N0V90_000400 [Kalmusia sp. IMI 367209]|nr:hypothetical protein N0V90_000400 [Kalmusia sp. IMI 367209]
MAETLAVLATVSSILQIVDFTSKIVDRLAEFLSDSDDIPQSLGHLKAELPLLSYTLQQIQEAIEAKRLPERSAAALRPTLQGCEQSMHQIESILEKTLPKPGDGKTKRAFKSVISVIKDGKIEFMLTSLGRYKATLTFYFAAASSSVLQPLKDKTLAKIRKWLSAPDPSVDFDKALRLRQANTGLWLLESDLYKRWKADASWLWLHGIPGCGKTVLSSTVLADIREYTKDDPGQALAYFYFDFNDRQKQDSEIMIRSLVAQLSQQCMRELPSLVDLFKSCEKTQRQPSLDALLVVLKDLINDFPCVYLAIDALDECERPSELMSIVEKIFQWKLQGLHVLLTSRREGDIKFILEKILDNQNILCIQTDAVDHDIQLYVHQQLDDEERFRKWRSDDKLRQRIETSVGGKARGMFRLAACQLEILKQCRNQRQLLNALNDLPPDLDETYNRILGTIKGDDVIYAIRILRWLAFSFRPLSLAEVAEVAALDADRSPGFDPEEVLADPSEVFDICSSLVTLVDSTGAKDPVLVLAHYSVKEYLVSKRILESEMKIYGMEIALCHSIIARCCVQYLLQFDRPAALTKENLDQFQLAKYSAQQWINHSIAGTKRNDKTVDMIGRLLNTKEQSYLTWTRLYDHAYPRRNANFKRQLDTVPTPLYYASLAGLTDIVELLIKGGADVNARHKIHKNALWAAISAGHLDIVQVLIENGADYSSALESGFFLDHPETIRSFIKIGIDVNVQCRVFDNALQAASCRGYQDIAQHLIEMGADVNAKGGRYGNALQAALFGDHLNLAMLLMKEGADVDAQGGRYGNALQAASLRGHLNMVQLLITKGANVNAHGGLYGDALQAASTTGHLDIVKLLIEKNAELNATGGPYGSALAAAVFFSHEDIAQLLMENGAQDVEAVAVAETT